MCKLSEIVIPKHSSVVGKKILEISLPENAQILLMNRDKTIFDPTGDTILQANDIALVLADRVTLNEIRAVLQTKHDEESYHDG